MQVQQAISLRTSAAVLPGAAAGRPGCFDGGAAPRAQAKAQGHHRTTWQLDGISAGRSASAAADRRDHAEDWRARGNQLPCDCILKVPAVSDQAPESS